MDGDIVTGRFYYLEYFLVWDDVTGEERLKPVLSSCEKVIRPGRKPDMDKAGEEDPLDFFFYAETEEDARLHFGLAVEAVDG
jgi:hypothetical protein